MDEWRIPRRIEIIVFKTKIPTVGKRGGQEEEVSKLKKEKQETM